MGKIDYKSIYDKNKEDWKELTNNPQKYEALLAGHYSESNHFVYELLQNAEDVSATKVLIEYRERELRFYHNGTPFDFDDVVGVSSMLMGTKDKNDGQKIGRFGMGFKSVFKYTDEPYIYSDDEAFMIKNYLLPVDIDVQWDYENSKKERKIRMVDGSWYRPFVGGEHLTKIVIPFHKRDVEGNVIEVDGSEVLDKLKRLTGEILLFLTHIREVVWIDKISEEYTKITIAQAVNDENLFTCRIEGTTYGGKEQITKFLKYKRVFDHTEMTNAEVSVAYKLNSIASDINAIESNNRIWVYFPTREYTALPFMIHGSFETAVSREKLMTPSKFNDSLKAELVELIAESMPDLAVRKMITQAFLRNVLMCAFEDEEKNGTLLGLRERVSTMFRTHSLLPDVEKNTYQLTDLLLPIPHEIAGFRNSSVFKNTFNTDRKFVAINNENQKYFIEYFNWLKDELRIKTFRLGDWFRELFPLSQVHISSTTYEIVDRFYSFLYNHREIDSAAGKSTTKNSSYDLEVKKDLGDAWRILREKPVILNTEGYFVPAFIDDEQNAYLGSSSSYKRLNGANIVHAAYADRFSRLFEEAFHLTKFDNFQYVKEKVLRKYINIDSNINFDNEDFEEEHIEDIQQILSLFDEINNDEVIRNLIHGAWILRTAPDENGDSYFAMPIQTYVCRSDDGMNLKKYFEESDCTIAGCSLFEIDQEFYEQHGISMSKLKRIGVITTPIIEGERQNLNGVGKNYWKALGDYCPNIRIIGLYENIAYIEENPDSELARYKSTQILKMLLMNSSKLKGSIKRQKTNPIIETSTAAFIQEDPAGHAYFFTYGEKSSVVTRRWVYNKGGELYAPDEISRYDLNGKIYKGIDADKESYEILGFIKSDDDEKFEAFEVISGLEKTDKTRLFKKLAKELGYDVTKTESEREDSYFDPDSYVEDEFPVRRVRNMEMLIHHVKEDFFCADPVRYVKVFRQIRRPKKGAREYALGMYVNSGGFQVCQMCREPKAGKFIEVTEIANFGIEMPQLKLCLCQECATKYKELRDNNKDRFKTEIDKALRALKVGDEEEFYKLQLSGDEVLHFTETHIAEVKTILTLIRENGLPSTNSEDDFESVIQKSQGNEGIQAGAKGKGSLPISNRQHGVESQDEARERAREERKQQRRAERERMMQMTIDDFYSQNSKPQETKDVVRIGSKVYYKVVGSKESGVFVSIDPKFSAQKLMIGKKLGDVVKDLKGKKYEITAIL